MCEERPEMTWKLPILVRNEGEDRGLPPPGSHLPLPLELGGGAAFLQCMNSEWDKGWLPRGMSRHVAKRWQDGNWAGKSPDTETDSTNGLNLAQTQIGT